MNKEVAQYINSLLADRERLLDERKDDDKDYELDFVLKQETEWELGIIYQAQKSMDYIIEEDTYWIKNLKNFSTNMKVIY